MTRKSRALWLVLLFTATLIFVAQDAQRLLTQPLALSNNLRFDVPPGHNLMSVLTKLQARGVILEQRLPRYLQAYARVSGRAALLKAGEYELTPGMNSLDLLALMVSGKVVLHELRLIEGWTFDDARAAVAQSQDLEHSLGDTAPQRVMAELDHPNMHPEGRFFPDTYRFPKGTTDVAFFRRAFATMARILEQEWQLRQADLPYRTPDEALIMASIIEKETAMPAERAQIAGVFVRRLQLGMKLQTDPTVIYGIGKGFDGNLRRRDLDHDTPYNTYMRGGLPPTPICLPGRASLIAALHPASGKSLYFVSRGDGSHQFSDSLEQHNAAVLRYQIKRTR